MTTKLNQPLLHEPARAPIKFIPRQEASLICPSTHELEEYLSRIKGKWAKQMANEIRMMFKCFLREGHFEFHTERLEFTYSQRFARNLLKTIRPFTKVVKDAGNKCARRVFLLNGINPTSECTTDSDLDYLMSNYLLYPLHTSLTYRTIPADFLTYRYDKWCDFCEKNGLDNHIDFDGRTEWGSVILEAQRSLLVPLESPEPSPDRGYSPEETKAFKEHTQARLDKLQAGVCNIAIRRHGRAIHVTTGLAREVREQTLIDGQETTELDLHATYWALLIMLMPDCEERDILIQIYQTHGFYSIFDFSVLPVGVNSKVEVMKQCLFLNNNEAMPPLRQQLRSKFPAFDSFICDLRTKHTPTGLSHLLTGLEGKAFVDMILPKLRKLGCKPNYNYDGIIVPIMQEEIALQVMTITLTKLLRFKPRIKTKSAGLLRCESA